MHPSTVQRKYAGHSSPPKVHPELQEICAHWSRTVGGMDDNEARMAYFAEELPGLLLNRRLFIKVLNDIRKGRPYADLRQATMFPDELLLYLDEARRFSLRMFIYESGAFTPVHDHNAWGVTGSTLGRLAVIGYRRLDNRETEGYARLTVDRETIYEPGQIELTQPLENGIHKTGNPDSGTTIMISVYGTPVRRLHINRYDIEHNRVFKWFPPRIRKKMLITGALKELMLEKRKQP